MSDEQHGHGRRPCAATRSLVLALVASVAVALVGCAVSAAAAVAAAPSVGWSKCFAKIGVFECGTVQVPLDYDAPNGATISIALVRLPATDPSRRLGSLLLNPGGPGGSGVDYALGAGPSLYTSEVRARFDLVGFDPRGIGRSTALRCFGTPRQWEPFFTPLAFPTSPEEEQVWIGAERYLDAACAQRGGQIADHMSTANVARDLDELRRAVGDDKLTYAGVSYGSYLGVTYANLFPRNVRALVVDGVLDPIAWSTGRGSESTSVPFSTRLHSDVGAQATLQEIFRLCDAAGPACAFAGDATARFAALAAAVRAQPVHVEFPDGTSLDVNYSILIAMTLGALYDSAAWADFAAVLADLESRAAPAALGARLQRFDARPAYIAKRGFPRYPNFVESLPAVACADSVNPRAYAAWSAAAAAADATGYFGRIWTWISSICAEWPHADGDRYTGPFDRRTANPVLVVGNQFDPATRYEGAVTVANLLPNSALLTVHGWGHTSLYLSQCADDAISRYLIGLALPAPGTVCEQDHVPFAGT
jgi:pimeloyl-ACP methyl ester carboxylesterase